MSSTGCTPSRIRGRQTPCRSFPAPSGERRPDGRCVLFLPVPSVGSTPCRRLPPAKPPPAVVTPTWNISRRHAAVPPLPAPQQFILSRSSREHTVMFLLVVAQATDHTADDAPAPVPIWELIIRWELPDELPCPIQLLDRHSRARACPRGQKHIKFLARLLGQLF